VVVEELVGEISDEFDPGYEPITEVEPGIYDVESGGGLIAGALGWIPATGDVIEHLPPRRQVREMAGYRVVLARSAASSEMSSCRTTVRRTRGAGT